MINKKKAKLEKIDEVLVNNLVVLFQYSLSLYHNIYNVHISSNTKLSFYYSLSTTTCMYNLILI